MVAAAGAALLREPLASLAGVDEPWAAAIVPPALFLWLALSLRRGVLQGQGAHRAVAGSLLLEGGARLVAAAALVLAGAGVAGALLGIAGRDAGRARGADEPRRRRRGGSRRGCAEACSGWSRSRCSRSSSTST